MGKRVAPTVSDLTERALNDGETEKELARRAYYRQEDEDGMTTQEIARRALRTVER